MADKSTKKASALVGSLKKKQAFAIAFVALVGFVFIRVTGNTSDQPAQAVPPNPRLIQFPLGDSRQAVVVTTDSWQDTDARLARFERRKDGSWKQVGRIVDAQIGVNGFNLAVQANDGSTPVGRVALVSAMGRDKRLDTRLPYRMLVPGDCWITDRKSPAFNRWVSRSPCKEPNVDLYSLAPVTLQWAVITDYNQAQSSDGGSAFFITRNTTKISGRTAPTGGPVALADPDITALLDWLDPAKQPTLITGPREWLLGLRSANPPAADDPAEWSPLRRGSKGDRVRAVQQFLTDNGFPTDIDGIFGPQTTRQVKAFQKKEGLVADGIVGRKTAVAMGLLSG